MCFSASSAFSGAYCLIISIIIIFSDHAILFLKPSFIKERRVFTRKCSAPAEKSSIRTTMRTARRRQKKGAGDYRSPFEGVGGYIRNQFYFAAAKPASRSARMSSIFSIPIERRIVFC